MKKIFLLAISLVTFAAQGQFIIPKVGATYTTVSFTDDDDAGIEYRTGISAGVAFQFLISDKFSIQPELNFVQKGSKTDYNETFDYGDGSFSIVESTAEDRLNYLQLPVLFKLKLGKFYVNAGPSVGFGLNGKGKFDYSSSGQDVFGYPFSFTSSGDYVYKFEEAPEGYEGNDKFLDNRMNLSVQVGGGVTVKEKIIIDVRYGLGMTKLDDQDTKHRVLQVTVGVPIKL